METPFDPKFGAVAAISATIGAAALKIVDRIFARREHAVDEETGLRRELREEGKDLRAQLRDAEAMVVEWREKYFLLLEQATLARARLAEDSARGRVRAGEDADVTKTRDIEDTQ